MTLNMHEEVVWVFKLLSERLGWRQWMELPGPGRVSDPEVEAGQRGRTLRLVGEEPQAAGVSPAGEWPWIGAGADPERA